MLEGAWAPVPAQPEGELLQPEPEQLRASRAPAPVKAGGRARSAVACGLTVRRDGEGGFAPPLLRPMRLGSPPTVWS